MDYEVILTGPYLRDLDRIVSYLSRYADSETAERVGTELIDQTHRLARNPNVGQPVRRRPETRKILLYSYCTYYRADESNKTVFVLRVRHGARNPKTLRLS